MCLSLDLCLLSILVKLIDLVNSVIISYDLTQIVKFPTQIPDCHSHSLAVLDFFFLLTLVFVLQWLSLYLEILIMLLPQFPLTFHHIHRGWPVSLHWL